MKKTVVKIRFQNGLGFDSVGQILTGLTDEYEFVDSSDPDVVVFGPYGSELPPVGSYQRVGYYCECISPDMEICEWAFGVPREEEVNHPRYRRIQWHGLNPESLIKQIDVDAIFEEKTKFCNFLYSNHIPYREEFFRQLSKYKKVDAPGKSMRNMSPIDQHYTGDTWAVKRKFLQPYKFTIAFESYSYPGYQTEKLYDAMRMNSIPVYCGDPLVGDIFNERSIVDLSAYVKPSYPYLGECLEKYGQYSFRDYQPGRYTGLKYRIRRKLKTIAKEQKMFYYTNKFDFRPLVDQIVELDQDPERYKKMLAEPWLNGNKVPALSVDDRWREIFKRAKYDG